MPWSQNTCPRQLRVPFLRAFAATQIETPIFTCSTETAEQSRLVRQQCSTMGGLQMEHGVAGKHFPISFIYCRRQFSAIGNDLSQTCMVQLNCHQRGVGLFRSTMYKWSVISTAACKCGVKKRRAEHVMTFFPNYRHPNGARVLSAVEKSFTPC